MVREPQRSLRRISELLDITGRAAPRPVRPRLPRPFSGLRSQLRSVVCLCPRVLSFLSALTDKGQGAECGQGWAEANSSSLPPVPSSSFPALHHGPAMCSGPHHRSAVALCASRRPGQHKRASTALLSTPPPPSGAPPSDSDATALCSLPLGPDRWSGCSVCLRCPHTCARRSAVAVIPSPLTLGALIVRCPHPPVDEPRPRPSLSPPPLSSSSPRPLRC